VKTIAVWDDLDWAAGLHTEAAEEVSLGLRGRWFVLDLSADNVTALEQALAPWLKVAHRPEGPVRPVLPESSHRKAPPGENARAYWQAFRDWCDDHGLRNPKNPEMPAYKTASGKDYSPRALVLQWLEDTGRDVEEARLHGRVVCGAH
jgi:Lsr2